MHKMNPGRLSLASRLALEEHARGSPRRVSRPPIKGRFDLIERNVAEAAQPHHRQRGGASDSRAAFEAWAMSSTPTSFDVYASLTPVSDGRPSSWSGVWQSDYAVQFNSSSSGSSSSNSGAILSRRSPRAGRLTARPTLSLEKHKERVQSSATDFARIRREQERAASVAAKNLPVREPTVVASPVVSPRMYTLPPPSPRERPIPVPVAEEAPSSASPATASAATSPAASRRPSSAAPIHMKATHPTGAVAFTPARAQSARPRLRVTDADLGGRAADRTAWTNAHRVRPPSPHSRFLGQRIVGGSFM